ncbi:ribulose-5-phosphate 4-epimerase/fuculose-1-phosphate aldolase [Bradyrhizobium daqingense]
MPPVSAWPPRNGFEEGICNHFSAVVPGHDDLFLVNPYGYAFRELTASKLLICDFHGNVLDGEGVPEATAFYIHAEMHKRLPRAKVAFHTHMPYATALSMTEGEPLIWAGQTALKFYGRTAVDRDYNGLALDNREGARIASAVGDADIVFMKHHGVMVLAPTIAEAWDDLYYLERAGRGAGARDVDGAEGPACRSRCCGRNLPADARRRFRIRAAASGRDPQAAGCGRAAVPALVLRRPS